MTLSSDITRCHDSWCIDRERCRRWLERSTGNIHVASMLPPDNPPDQSCTMRIPPRQIQ